MHLSEFARAFRPTFRQLIGYIVLSLFILVVTRFFFKEIAGISEVEKEIIPLMRERFDLFFDNLNQNRLTSTFTLAIFWGAIGAVAYVIVTTIARMVQNTQHLVVEELSYLRPDPASLRKQRIATAGKIILRISIMFIALTVLLLTLQIVLPLSLHYFDTFLNDLRSPSAPLKAFLSVFSLSGAIYIITGFIRLLFSKPDNQF